MKYVKKLVLFVLLIALAGTLFFAGGFASKGVAEGFKNLFSTIFDYLKVWNGLDTRRLVIKIVAMVGAVVLIVLPIVGIVLSISRNKTKKDVDVLDFLNCYGATLVIGIVAVMAKNASFTKKYGYALLLVCLLLLVVTEVLLILGTKDKASKADKLETGKVYYVNDGTNDYKVTVLGEGKEEPVQAKEEPVKEEVKEEPKPTVVEKPVEKSEEKPAEEPVETVEEPDDEADDNESDDETDEAEGGEPTAEKADRKPSLTYIQRLDASEDSLKQSYSVIKNQLLKHRKVHARISKSCETFRVGYDVIAKFVVAGKSLKVYLAMDPYGVDSAIYHQRDASSKKRFVEVPLVVKVKSPLSVKKACQLVDKTCEGKNVLPKSRYEEVDYSKIEVGQ